MKGSSRFFSSMGLLIVLNAVIKPVWIFGIDRAVQNTVGVAEYGAYFSLFNFSVVLSFLLDWGYTNFYNRQLAAKEKDFTDRAGNYLYIKFIFALSYIVVVFSAGWLVGISRWDILFSVVFIQVLQSLFLFFRGIITAHQWFRTDAWLSVLDKTLMTLLCGSLLYFPSVFGDITIGRFLQIQVFCTLFASLVSWFILINKGIQFTFYKRVFIQKQIFYQALPFGIIILLMSIHYRLDGFLLERIHVNGDHEAGIYASAYRLLDAANMIGALVAMFLLPYGARHWSDKENYSNVVLGARHFLILFSIAVGTIAVFLAPWIQKTLYHYDSIEAIEVMRWCLPALIGYSLVHVYGTVLTATGNIVPFCYITLNAVVINVVLNLMLIPSLGALGCCYAALISQFFCGVLSMFYAWKKSMASIHFRSIFAYIFTAALLSGFLYWCSKMSVEPLLQLLGVAAISLVALFATGVKEWLLWLGSFRNSELK